MKKKLFRRIIAGVTMAEIVFQPLMPAAGLMIASLAAAPPVRAQQVKKCDGWADPGSEHRNSGNGCFYRCQDDGAWSAPLKCDGQGNGQFQGQAAKTEEERRIQEAEVARRAQEAAQQLAQQTATETQRIAAETIRQRALEEEKQKQMAAEQLAAAQTEAERIRQQDAGKAKALEEEAKKRAAAAAANIEKVTLELPKEPPSDSTGRPVEQVNIPGLAGDKAWGDCKLAAGSDADCTKKAQEAYVKTEAGEIAKEFAAGGTAETYYQKNADRKRQDAVNGQIAQEVLKQLNEQGRSTNQLNPEEYDRVQKVIRLSLPQADALNTVLETDNSEIQKLVSAGISGQAAAETSALVGEILSTTGAVKVLPTAAAYSPDDPKGTGCGPKNFGKETFDENKIKYICTTAASWQKCDKKDSDWTCPVVESTTAAGEVVFAGNVGGGCSADGLKVLKGETVIQDCSVKKMVCGRDSAGRTTCLDPKRLDLNTNLQESDTEEYRFNPQNHSIETRIPNGSWETVKTCEPTQIGASYGGYWNCRDTDLTQLQIERTVNPCAGYSDGTPVKVDFDPNTKKDICLTCTSGRLGGMPSDCPSRRGGGTEPTLQPTIPAGGYDANDYFRCKNSDGGVWNGFMCLARPTPEPTRTENIPGGTASYECQGETLIKTEKRTVNAGKFGSTIQPVVTSQVCEWGCGGGACRVPGPDEMAAKQSSIWKNATEMAQLACQNQGRTNCSFAAVMAEAPKYVNPDELSPTIKQVFNDSAWVPDALKQELIDQRVAELKAKYSPKIPLETIRAEAESFVNDMLASGALRPETTDNLTPDSPEWKAFVQNAQDHPSLFQTLIGGRYGGEADVADLQMQFYSLFLTGGEVMGNTLGAQNLPYFQARKVKEEVIAECGLKGWENTLTPEQEVCLRGESLAAKANISHLQEEREINAAIQIASGVAAVFSGGAGGAAFKAAPKLIQFAAETIPQIVSDAAFAPVFADLYVGDDRRRAETLKLLAQTAPVGSDEAKIWSRQAAAAGEQAENQYQQELFNGFVMAGVSNLAFGGIAPAGKAVFGDSPVGKLVFGSATEAEFKAAARETAEAMNASAALSDVGHRVTTAEEVEVLAVQARQDLTRPENVLGQKAVVVSQDAAVPAGAEVALAVENYPIRPESGSLFDRAGQTVGELVDAVGDLLPGRTKPPEVETPVKLGRQTPEIFQQPGRVDIYGPRQPVRSIDFDPASPKALDDLPAGATVDNVDGLGYVKNPDGSWTPLGAEKGGGGEGGQPVYGQTNYYKHDESIVGEAGTVVSLNPTQTGFGNTIGLVPAKNDILIVNGQRATELVTVGPNDDIHINGQKFKVVEIEASPFTKVEDRKVRFTKEISDSNRFYTADGKVIEVDPESQLGVLGGAGGAYRARDVSCGGPDCIAKIIDPNGTLLYGADIDVDKYARLEFEVLQQRYNVSGSGKIENPGHIYPKPGELIFDANGKVAGYTMEEIHGVTLDRYKGPPLPKELVDDLVGKLTLLNKNSLPHGDIKLNNIIIETKPASGLFGLLKGEEPVGIRVIDPYPVGLEGTENELFTLRIGDNLAAGEINEGGVIPVKGPSVVERVRDSTGRILDNALDPIRRTIEPIDRIRANISPDKADFSIRNNGTVYLNESGLVVSDLPRGARSYGGVVVGTDEVGMKISVYNLYEDDVVTRNGVRLKSGEMGYSIDLEGYVELIDVRPGEVFTVRNVEYRVTGGEKGRLAIEARPIGGQKFPEVRTGIGGWVENIRDLLPGRTKPPEVETPVKLGRQTPEIFQQPGRVDIYGPRQPVRSIDFDPASPQALDDLPAGATVDNVDGLGYVKNPDGSWTPLGAEKGGGGEGVTDVAEITTFDPVRVTANTIRDVYTSFSQMLEGLGSSARVYPIRETELFPGVESQLLSLKAQAATPVQRQIIGTVITGFPSTLKNAQEYFPDSPHLATIFVEDKLKPLLKEDPVFYYATIDALKSDISAAKTYIDTNYAKVLSDVSGSLKEVKLFHVTDREFDEYHLYLHFDESNLPENATVVEIGSGARQKFSQGMSQRRPDVKVAELDASLALPLNDKFYDDLARSDQRLVYNIQEEAGREVMGSTFEMRQRRKKVQPGTFAAIVPELPISSSSTDSIVDMFGPGYYLPKEQRVEYFSEINRILKPGGEATLFPIDTGKEAADFFSFKKTGQDEYFTQVEGRTRSELLGADIDPDQFSFYHQEDLNGNLRVGVKINKPSGINGIIEGVVQTVKESIGIDQPLGIVAPGFREGEVFGPKGPLDFDWKGFRNEDIGGLQFPLERGSAFNNLPTDRGTIVPTNSRLWETRSDDVVRAIDDSFQELISEAPRPSSFGQHLPGYIFEGREVYSFGGIKTDEVISVSINSKTPGNTVSILDIGTANGFFIQHVKEVYGDNVSVSGLTAHDYRTPSNPLTGFDYRLGNAEHLLDIYGKNSFDIVATNVTISHFKDPLGGIVQMYEVLKPNGILLIDSFEAPGLEGKLRALIDYMQSRGYQVTAEFGIDSGARIEDATIDFLIVRKTHEHLDLPVEYGGVNKEGNAVYRLTGELSPVTEDRAFTYLSSLKPAKYGGEPIGHYGDFRDDLDLSKLKRSWQQQLKHAKENGANWWEFRELEKQQQAVEKAIEIHRKDHSRLLKDAKQILGVEAGGETARSKGKAGGERSNLAVAGPNNPAVRVGKAVAVVAGGIRRAFSDATFVALKFYDRSTNSTDAGGKPGGEENCDINNAGVAVWNLLARIGREQGLQNYIENRKDCNTQNGTPLAELSTRPDESYCLSPGYIVNLSGGQTELKECQAGCDRFTGRCFEAEIDKNTLKNPPASGYVCIQNHGAPDGIDEYVAQFSYSGGPEIVGQCLIGESCKNGACYRDVNIYKTPQLMDVAQDTLEAKSLLEQMESEYDTRIFLDPDTSPLTVLELKRIKNTCDKLPMSWCKAARFIFSDNGETRGTFSTKTVIFNKATSSPGNFDFGYTYGVGEYKFPTNFLIHELSHTREGVRGIDVTGGAELGFYNEAFGQENPQNGAFIIDFIYKTGWYLDTAANPPDWKLTNPERYTSDPNAYLMTTPAEMMAVMSEAYAYDSESFKQLWPDLYSLYHDVLFEGYEYKNGVWINPEEVKTNQRSALPAGRPKSPENLINLAPDQNSALGIGRIAGVISQRTSLLEKSQIQQQKGYHKYSISNDSFDIKISPVNFGISDHSDHWYNPLLNTNAMNKDIENNISKFIRMKSIRVSRVYAAERGGARVVPLGIYRGLAGRILLKKSLEQLPKDQLTAEKVAENLVIAGRASANLPQKGQFVSTGNGIMGVTGTSGVIAGGIRKGVYKVSVVPIPGFDLIVPAKIDAGGRDFAGLTIGIVPGRGRIKIAGQINLWQKVWLGLGKWVTRIIAPEVGAAENNLAPIVPLTVQLFRDENKNGVFDPGEAPVEWAGVKVNLESAAKTKNVNFQLTEGWNLIAFPVIPDSVTKASELVKDVALNGGYVTTVSAWDGNRWVEYSQRGAEAFGNDFKLEPGRAYFVRSHADSAWAVSGTPLDDQILTISLKKGWNGVGIPSENTTAVQVMDEVQITDNREQRTVGGELADQVGRWDYGLWDVVIKRRYSPEHHEIYGRDFPIKDTEGYFLHLNEDAKWTK